jgi:hypothetical protein
MLVNSPSQAGGTIIYTQFLFVFAFTNALKFDTQDRDTDKMETKKQDILEKFHASRFFCHPSWGCVIPK